MIDVASVEYPAVTLKRQTTEVCPHMRKPAESRSTCRNSIVLDYAQWLRQINWQLFCTLTFGYQVSECQANGIFTEFINRTEKTLRAPLIYVRGEEIRYSGCGMPPIPRHFHLVLACEVRLEGIILGRLWERMAGERANGAGADMRRYDPSRDGI